MTASVDAPTYDADIYDDHSLLDPYEHYRALRDLGPAVWLEAHGAYAVSRYDAGRARPLGHALPPRHAGVLVYRFEGREFPEELAAAVAVARTSAPEAVAPGRAVTDLVHGIDEQERC